MVGQFEDPLPSLFVPFFRYTSGHAQRYPGSVNDLSTVGPDRRGPSWHLPAFHPGTWYPVLEAPPATVDTPFLPGYMWVELHGKPRPVWAAHFEMREDFNERTS